MNTDKQWVVLFLLTLGSFIIATGVWIRIGRLRSWFIAPNYPVLMPKGVHYAYIPIGLAFIAMGISLLVPTPTQSRCVWQYVIFPLFGITLLLIIVQPKFIKPKWINWLERNHKDILDILIEEGRKTSDWAKRVNTQEGLETWVEEVKRKRGIK